MTNGYDIATHVDGILHAETQVHERGVDLSVARVVRVTDAGRVDFGGGELEAAATEPVETEQRNQGDDYGWWNLAAGSYVVRYNETLTLPDGTRAWLQPRDELLFRGASHPTLAVGPRGGVDDLEGVPLHVGGAGLRLKENARVSTLLSD